jgi:hypothetical protein
MTKNTAAKTKRDAEGDLKRDLNRDLGRQELGRQELGREQSARRGSSREETDRAAPQLDRCYGAIGISAVAAALRYQSEAKNPAYAPVVHQLDKDTADAAV